MSRSNPPHPDLVATLLGPRRVCCVVGAGGKKTTMYALAAASSGRVALSSTSHMYPYDRRCVDTVVTLGEGQSRWAAPAGRVVAFGGATDTDHRVGGLSEAQIDALVQDSAFAHVILKADGARARWIKAPADYEPVIPACAERVLYLVSAKVIGRILDERIAHRPERIAEVTGATVGAALSAEHVGRLLVAEEGALKGLGHAEIVPVLNMVDDDATEVLARRAADYALAHTARYARVVLASMQAARIVAECRRA